MWSEKPIPRRTPLPLPPILPARGLRHLDLLAESAEPNDLVHVMLASIFADFGRLFPFFAVFDQETSYLRDSTTVVEEI